jgi:hypothetical protein
MRTIAIVLLFTTCCTPRAGRSPGAAGREDDDTASVRAQTNLVAARECDREGVRSFQDGRFGDAIRYFRAAYRLGGPSSELWNVARARERVDDPEGAASAIEEYLAQRDLAPQDRAEAEREERALRVRPSLLTVATNPPGAVVTVDKKQTAGPTPLSIEIPAGPHTISVRRDGYVVATQPLQARFGRAVIISLDLQRSPK